MGFLLQIHFHHPLMGKFTDYGRPVSFFFQQIPNVLADWADCCKVKVVLSANILLHLHHSLLSQVSQSHDPGKRAIT